jgi:hypothetical protein
MREHKTEDIETLKKLFTWNAETGSLVWKERPTEMFGRHQDWVTWNKRFAGKEALNHVCAGYCFGGIFGRVFRKHRVLWALEHGEWPDNIDHINGNGLDNRLANLRSVPQSVNTKNMRLSKRNKSGVIGVAWIPRLKKWEAKLSSGGKFVYLGLHSKKEDAIAARLEANAQHGFHANHGH